MPSHAKMLPHFGENATKISTDSRNDHDFDVTAWLMGRERLKDDRLRLAHIMPKLAAFDAARDEVKRAKAKMIAYYRMRAYGNAYDSEVRRAWVDYNLACFNLELVEMDLKLTEGQFDE